MVVQERYSKQQLYQTW